MAIRPKVMITYNNETKSRRAWAKEFGISDQALARRLLRMPLDQAMQPGKIPAGYYGKRLRLTWQGREQTLDEWSAETGIPAQTLYTRYRDGKTMDEVFSSTPLPKAGRGEAWTDIDKPWREDKYAQKLVEEHPYGMTLDEIGRELGVSRERVRQIENEALRKLRFVLRLRQTMYGHLADTLNLPTAEQIRDALQWLTETRDRQTVVYPEPCEGYWRNETSGVVAKLPANGNGDRAKEAV